MFNYTVRPAGLGDSVAIYKLTVKMLGSKLTFDDMEDIYRNILIDPMQTILVAVHSGRIVGYIHARQVNNLYEEVHTEVEGYALYDYYRERGADKALFCALEKWSVQMTSRKIVVGLDAANSETVKNLLEIGFRELAPVGNCSANETLPKDEAKNRKAQGKATPSYCMYVKEL